MKLNRKILTAAAVVGCLSVNTISVLAGTDGATHNSTGTVTFKASDETTNPVDPTNPGVVVTPDGDNKAGTAGPLSIDFASSLDFGTQVITTSDQTYYAAAQGVSYLDTDGVTTVEEDRPNYVQVTDNRGTETGWVLKVKQDAQFVNGTNQLTGAQITMNNVEVATASSSAEPSNVASSVALTAMNTETLVMSAQEGEGAGTYVARFGDTTTMEESVELSVPGSTTKYAGAYTTSLTWVLSNVPE